MSEKKDPKFVLIVSLKPKRIFSMFLEKEIYICQEWEDGLMKTFNSQEEAEKYSKELYEVSGHQLILGFLDYVEGNPFVESCEALGAD